MAYTPVFFFSGGGPTHIYFASDAHVSYTNRNLKLKALKKIITDALDY